MLGAQLGQGLRLEVVPVAGTELGQLLDVELAGHPRRELVEEVLEASRRDDLEDPAGSVVRVPERVPLIARLEHEVPGLGVDDIVAELRAHSALEDEAVLVLALVDVHRGDEGLGRDRMLDEREPAAGLLRPGQKADADRSEVDELPPVGADDARPLARIEAGEVLGLGDGHDLVLSVD